MRWRALDVGTQVALHASLAAIMWMKSQKVDLQDSKALYAFYMFIWKVRRSPHSRLPLRPSPSPRT